ncbi:MAG: methyltransferase domain-containing protein [Deltaproteobacteria bacterium]|nr:methyltransferase domain-containing protein [Deltaproteobacteria bacterium]
MKPDRFYWRCIQCGRALDVPQGVSGQDACPACGHEYSYEPDFFRTSFHLLLFEKYKKQYLINRALNNNAYLNNAYLSYVFIPDRSVSLLEREDVKLFRDFVREQLIEGPVLDNGCGPLPLPGYLNIPSLFEDRDVFGLDPMDKISFQGFRVLGCAEFTPFPDAYLQNIIFATSLDHVVSLDQTVKETWRILRSGGRVIIWMGDRSRSLVQRIRGWIFSTIKSLQAGYNVRRYGIYPELKLVLYIPHGAYDAYHSWAESPGKIKSLMIRSGFKLIEERKPVRNQAYLCFAKPSTGASVK